MGAVAEPVVHIDDTRFKVTEWRFAPGATTGWHVHGHDYVIVPLTDGVLGLSHPDGTKSEAPLTRGVPYSRRTGVEHDVRNAGPAPLSFLEIEVVDDAVASARHGLLTRFGAAWNDRDMDTMMACMADDCAFHAAGGPEAEGKRHIGRAAVQAAYAAIFEAFPVCHWEASGVHVVGDTGLSTWRFTGTTRDGKTVDVDGCDVFRFDGALIALKDSYRKARG